MFDSHQIQQLVGVGVLKLQIHNSRNNTGTELDHHHLSVWWWLSSRWRCTRALPLLWDSTLGIFVHDQFLVQSTELRRGGNTGNLDLATRLESSSCGNFSAFFGFAKNGCISWLLVTTSCKRFHKCSRNNYWYISIIKIIWCNSRVWRTTLPDRIECNIRILT